MKRTSYHTFELALLEQLAELSIQSQKVWDPVRQMYFDIKPEELVRQCFIRYAHEVLGFSLKRMSIEKIFKVGNVSKRYDFLYANLQGEFVFLAEFKRPEVELTEKVIEQTSIYNAYLDAKFILISNGYKNIMLERLSKDSYTYLDHIPNDNYIKHGIG